MAKRVNGRAIKSVRTYTIEEVADALSVSIVTVRSWEKRGLQFLKHQRPYLILGAVLKSFLDHDAESRKRPLAKNQFYCAPCKRRVTPMGGLADYVLTNSANGLLIGLCPLCERTIQRFASPSSLPEFEAVLEIVVRHAQHA